MIGKLESFSRVLESRDKMDKTKVLQQIISLRYMIDNYREARMFWKVAELHLEIARLQAILEA